MTVRIINADVLDGLGQLDDESVQCCVTSPPYWGLRDYGVAGQIGLEATPELFVARMVDVFREVRRALRKDGVLFLNLGDSYARDVAKGGSGPNGKHDSIPDYGNARKIMSESKGSSDGKVGRGDRAALRNGAAGLKPKDLVGIPWMTAFALRADGWYLRQEIIWNKPNPMPESVRDRCTKAHEHIFLLTKSERYRFDAAAIREACSDGSHGSPNVNPGWKAVETNDPKGSLGKWTATDKANGRNKRSVWTISTTPYSEAHFATFPEELPETCIKAGCPAGGTVLDPFGGAGTTGLVADKLGRNAILIELNPEYAAMAEKRVKGNCPLFADVSPPEKKPEQQNMFDSQQGG